MTRKIKAGDSFLPKGETTIDNLIKVHSVEGDVLSCSPEGGGFVRSIKVDAFLERYEFVDDARIEAMRAGYRSEMVSAGDDEVGVPGWVNGHRWNGFLMPLLERSAVETMIEREFSNGGEYGTVLYPEGDGFVLVEAACGESLPPIDRERMLALLGEGDRAEDEIEGRDKEPIEIYVTRCSPSEIEVDGRRIEVFSIGDGWTWSSVEQASSPAP